MLMTSQLKVGTAFMYEGNALIVQKMLGQRSGRAGMVTSFRVKNLVTNSTMDLGIDAGEKFDEVDLDSHTTKLSYIDGDTFVFMDQDTYEQFELAKDDGIISLIIPKNLLHISSYKKISWLNSLSNSKLAFASTITGKKHTKNNVTSFFIFYSLFNRTGWEVSALGYGKGGTRIYNDDWSGELQRACRFGTNLLQVD